MDTEQRAVLDSILNAEKINLTEPDTILNAKLYDYQKKAVCYLYHSKRAILGDPVGSGKTLTCMALFAFLRKRGENCKAIVICPASIVYQWKNEIEHYSSFKALVVKGTKDKRMALWNDAKNFDFCITNYETLRMDLDDIAAFHWDMVLCDEATHFKNRETGVAKSIKALIDRMRPDRAYALTATPLQNNLMELFSILEPINPDVLGNYYAFKYRYCIEKLFEVFRNGRVVKFKKIVGYRYPLEVRERIRYNFIGRQKSEILKELPPLVHQYRWLTLLPKQQKAYDDVMNGILKSGKKIKSVETVQKILYALEICNGIFMVDKRKKESCKIEEIKNLLTGELSGEKVVIFSFYKKMINEIEKECEKLELNPLRITGDEGKEQREVNKQKFIHEDKYKVLLGTSAIEEGLNLQQAGYMIVVDRMYNPQRMKQLYGRLHRVGQTHDQVTIIHLIVKDSIEERVLKILEAKEKLFKEVFHSESDKNLLMGMEEEEIRQVIGNINTSSSKKRKAVKSNSEEVQEKYA